MSKKRVDHFRPNPKKYRERRPRFLILVEGQVTEREYFNAIRQGLRLPANNLKIEGPPPTSPVEMVEKAKLLRRAEKDAPYKEVWCVFDAESKLTQVCREGLQEALKLADDSGVSVALSNPCFELWLALHCEGETCEAWIDSHQIQRRAEALGLIAEKRISDPEAVLCNCEHARKGALRLCQMHERNGTPLHARNPSTTVYKLVEAIYTSFERKA